MSEITSCSACDDTGMLETGIGYVPCDCSAGATAKFQVVEHLVLTGQQMRDREAGRGRVGFTANQTLHDQVLEFHRTFDHPVRETPGMISEERVWFRARLIAEEFFEVLEACFTDEVVCDGRLGHSVGTRATDGTVQSHPCPSCGNVYHTLGLHTLEEGIRELIAKSGVRVNLPELADGLADLDYVVEGTRVELGIDGAPIAVEVQRANMTKTPAGKEKPRKPPGWTPPDIEGELRKQGWRHD